MSEPIVDSDALATYLGIDSIDEDRAEALIGWAQTLCEAIVSPLPAGAAPVVLDVAARAFTNPTNTTAQSMPVGSVSYGAISGGLWLTRQNKATLRNLAGGGGAFTIDVTPEGAAQDLPWWDISGGQPFGDWDVPA